MTAIPRHIIESALGDAEYDEIREDYFGRGMYGDSCFGVVLRLGRDLAVFLFGLGYESRDLEDSDSPEYRALADNLHRMTRVAQIDSMGSDSIVYLPGYTLCD